MVIDNISIAAAVARDPSCGYNKRFKYNIPINNTGIPYFVVVWCAENCNHRWGWWFDKKTKEARMSFENRNESIFYCFKWGEQINAHSQ